jgi:hypothetical protein
LASARAAGAAVTRTRPKTRTQPAPAEPRKRQPSPRTKPRTTAPKTRSRAKARARSRGGIAWIVVGGLLLGGVVFVNVLVLQLNLRLDSATQLQTKLKAQNASLQSELAGALTSSRIQSLAHTQDGVVQADPATTRYIDLGK